MSKIIKQADVFRILLCGSNQDAIYENEDLVTATGGSTTTIISTSDLTETADDHYVGYVAECIEATNTENEGVCRLITSFANGTDTGTVDAFPASVSSGDNFRLIDTGIAFAVEETGGASVTVDCPAISDTYNIHREEAEHFFYDENQGDLSTYLSPISADNKTAEQLISAFSAGSFTVADDSLNTAVGDLFVPVQYIHGSCEVSTEIARPEKVSKIGALGKVSQPCNRIKNATATIETYVNECLKPLLKSAFYNEDNGSGGSAQIPGSNTTTLLLDTDEGDNFSVGDLIEINGQIREVTVISDDTLTIAPALSIAPEAGDPVTKGLQFYPKLGESLQFFGLESWHGDFQCEILYGCTANFTFSGERGSLCKCSVEVTSCGFFERPTTRSWRTYLPSKKHASSDRARIYIGSTELELIKFSINTGVSIIDKESLNSPNGKYSKELANCEPTLTATVMFDSNSLKLFNEKYSSHTADVLVECGDTKKIGFIFKNAQINSSTWADSNGVYVVDLEIVPTEILSRGQDASPFRLALFQ